jgi:hypothetical protein
MDSQGEATMQCKTLIRSLAAVAATALALGAAPARADETAVRAAMEEAAAVHAIATAARLCTLITETELRHSLSRMDRVHAAQLDTRDRETYLILRGSDSFRDRVFASALRRAQGGGCQADLPVVWRDIHASLVMADAAASNRLADAGGAPTAR